MTVSLTARDKLLPVRPILLREDSLRSSFGPTPSAADQADPAAPPPRVDPEDAG